MATTTNKNAMVQTHVGGWRAEHRTRGCMVTALDSDALLDFAVKAMAAAEGWKGEEVDGWKLESDLVLGKSGSDEHEFVIICTEGVGWILHEGGDMIVPLRWGWSGTYNAHVRIDDVMACVTEREIDLADFVRAFGDRLEDNFRIWFRYIQS
jgi:hypothetical protein